MGTRRNSAALLAGSALIYLVRIAEVAQILRLECEQPEERCIPLRYCPPYFERVKKGYVLTNETFKNQLVGLMCRAKPQFDMTTHICCSKPNIRCSWNDNPAACTRPERCPSFNNKNESDLLLSNDANLCYGHNHKKFFCCPSEYCAMHVGLCDADDDTPLWERSPSAFPKCEGEGSLVPLPLCSGSMMFPGEKRTCCKPSQNPTLIPKQNASLLAKMKCGYIGDTVKIQSGILTLQGEFPWMVALRFRLYPARNCGGTLIHPRYILTAAHCLQNTNINQVTVHLGDHVLRNFGTCIEPNVCPPGVQEISIAEKIVHNKHDIALLRLSRPADIVPGAAVPICLPIYERLQMHLPTKLTITGWGMATDQEHESKTLLKADTQVLQNQTGCGLEHNFCAGGDHYSNHCRGDSGGPYQALDRYNESLRYVQYGVISKGSKQCENPDTPSRGVLVGYFINWILDNMDLS